MDGGEPRSLNQTPRPTAYALNPEPRIRILEPGSLNPNPEP